MAGLNFSTLHKELITSNFKTRLSGVCFQFGVVMILNYFYTELAKFSLFITYDAKAAAPFPIYHTALRSSLQKRWQSSGAPCPHPPYESKQGASPPPANGASSAKEREEGQQPTSALSGVI